MPDNYYKKYIVSERWKAKRQLWFDTFGKWCRACGKSSGPIQLHHYDYSRLGNERLSDMVALCKQCHKEVETLYRRSGRMDRRMVTTAFIKRKRGSSLKLRR